MTRTVSRLYTYWLDSTPVKKWRILLEQSVSARMPLLMTTCTFRIKRRQKSSFLNGVNYTVAMLYCHNVNLIINADVKQC